MGHDMESGFPREEWVESLVRQALAEDVGPRDVSTAISVDPAATGRGDLVSRDNGVVAGLPLLKMVYRQVDPDVSVESVVSDGTPVGPGSVVARLDGPVASILKSGMCF